jgi:glutamate racemase
VQIIDSTDVVAQAVQQRLASNNLLSEEKKNPHRFYVSDYTASFESTTRLFYQEEIALEHSAIW